MGPTGSAECPADGHTDSRPGFILETNEGTERRFESRERALEQLVRQAWAERIVTTVITRPDYPHRAASIILHGAPQVFHD
jgi:hypothetical protein